MGGKHSVSKVRCRLAIVHLTNICSHRISSAIQHQSHGDPILSEAELSSGDSCRNSTIVRTRLQRITFEVILLAYLFFSSVLRLARRSDMEAQLFVTLHILSASPSTSRMHVLRMGIGIT